MSAIKINDTENSILLPEADFLSIYDIDKSLYKASGLNWKILNEIFNDFIKVRDSLNQAGQAVVNILLSSEATSHGVHSVRFRVKTPYGLIEKIIRKTIDNYSEKKKKQ